MSKAKRNWVKPGCLAANLEYEKQREKTINDNKRRVEALGLTHLAASFNGPDHPKCTNKKGKSIVGDTRSDDDYIPSNSGDDDSFDDLEHEVTEMPPARRLTFSEPSISQPVNDVVDEAILHNVVGSLERNSMSAGISDHNVVGEGSSEPRASSEPRGSEPRASSVGSSTNRRGPTRCLGTDVRIEKEGKLPVLIPTAFRQPVGPHATRFAVATGLQIRQNLQRSSIRRWSKVLETSVVPIIQRVNDKFNVEGDEVAIQKARKTKCGTLLSGWTHRLYKHYKHLRDTNNEEHARNNYPKKLCTQDQWTDLIDNKWNDPKFLHQSAVNSANRARKRTNHVCVSSSFAMKAHQLLVEKNGDIDFPDFYHSCHFSKLKNKWVSSDCTTYHDEMIKLQENHNLQPNATPLSAEELSVQCLGARSGIVKGLGMRPSSSSRSLVTSIQTIEKKMERKMAEKISEIQSTTLSQIQEMADRMASIFQWAQRLGYDMPGNSTGANGTS